MADTSTEESRVPAVEANRDASKPRRKRLGNGWGHM